jgi:hypothetical protein
MVNPDGPQRLLQTPREVLRLEQSVADLTAQLAQAQADLQDARARAVVDRRTGCLVERALEERLAYEIARAARFGRELAVVIVLADDPASEGPAPELLELCRSGCRRTDLLGLAAEGALALVLVLPETPITGALVLAERLRLRSRPRQIRVGCAAWTREAKGPAELLSTARRAAQAGI